MKWHVLYLCLGIVLGLASGFALTPFSVTNQDVSIALWMEIMHRCCTSIGGLGTCVALIFVVRQFNLLQSQSMLMQKNILASMDNGLYGRLDSFNKFIVDHFVEYEQLDLSFNSRDILEHRSKLHHLCDLGITLYEEVHRHHVKYGLIDTDDWQEWHQNMVHFFRKPYVQGYWHMVAHRYGRNFQTYCNAVVKNIEKEK